MRWSSTRAAPPTQFLDDQDVPLQGQSAFQSWVPIVDNPRLHSWSLHGARLAGPVPSARATIGTARALPKAAWTAEVELIAMGEPRRQSGIGRGWPRGLHRSGAFAARSRSGPASMTRALDRVCTTIVPSRRTMNSNACAAQTSSAPAGMWRLRRHFAVVKSEYEAHMQLPCGLRAARRRNALQQHRGVQRELPRCCITSIWSVPSPTSCALS